MLAWWRVPDSRYSKSSTTGGFWPRLDLAKGYVEALGESGVVVTYDRLSTTVAQFGSLEAGRVARELDVKLEKLIDIKRKLTRPKDRFMLIHLEATLEERERMRD